jgi:seryl-tRNA synthetase
VAGFNALEAERKQIQTRTEELQGKRNTLSKQIGMLKGKGEDASAVMAEVNGIGDELKASATRLEEVQQQMTLFLQAVPNLPHESVPVGNDESGNVECARSVRRAVRLRDQGPRRCRRPAGPGLRYRHQADRFALRRAEGRHRPPAPRAGAVHAQHPYHGAWLHRVLHPYIVNADSLRGTGQLPKFEATCSPPRRAARKARPRTPRCT